MLAPAEALPHIKCHICNNYLSYFPISTNSDSNRSICGRCSEVPTLTENYVRDTAYEALAQFLKFPCIYAVEGCIEQLMPSDIPQHEIICPHRIVCCPLDCIWQGTVNELHTHIEEIHQNAVLVNGEFEMDTLKSYETYSFLIHNDEIFTLKRKYSVEDKVFQCSLLCYKSLENVTKYFYEITTYNGTRSLCVKFPLKSADNFQENNITEIRIEDVKKKLDDPSIIIGSVRLLTTEDQKPAVIVKGKKQNSEINYEMLSELECPVCMEYLIPPIYQCMSSHSICSNCKDQLTDCPICHQQILGKNIILEKMTCLITYPCKYSEAGCEFVAKPAQMKQHQKYCSLAPHACPLKNYENCKWTGQAKLTYAHVTKQHHDNLLEIDNIHVFLNEGYFETEESRCYIKQFSSVMFLLHYKYSRNCFYWSMQLIGPDDEAKNYKFEIDILDNTNSNQKLFLRSVCTPLKNKEDTFVEPGQYVFFTLEQIRSFTTDHLSYTVRITK